MSVPYWNWRRVALTTVMAAGLILGASLLYFCGIALLVAFIALLIATPLRPLVRSIERWGASRTLAVVSVHVSVVVVVLMCLAAILPIAMKQGSELLASLPGRYDALQGQLERSESKAMRQLGGQLPEELPWERELGEAESRMYPSVWQLTSAICWYTVLATACLLASVYWSIERDKLIQFVRLMVPRPRRDAVREVVLLVERKLGAFVRGQATLCVMVGLMAWGAYWWIGLPYAPVLGLIAGTCEAVPVIGPIVGTIPAILVGANIGAATVIWVVVANITIASIESYLLVPRIMNRAVGVHPIVTLLSITALFALLGPIGGVLAVPLAAIIQLVFQRFVFSSHQSLNELDSSQRDRVAVMRYRVQQLLDKFYSQMSRPRREDTSTWDECFEEEIELMLRRFGELLQQSRSTESRP